MLDPRIKQDILNHHRYLTEQGKLPSAEKLNQYYTAFRERFGPERLRNLDGETLLFTMHGLSSADRNTMVYWLEFKNDDEFPQLFGSISGGSAFKFGVYQSAQTGEWMGRGPGNSSIKLSLDQAIVIARRHRDQLLRGVALLEKLSTEATDSVYAQLQADMDELAPDVSGVAWGHKYFSLLFSTKLDDYHVANYQRFHLVRCLQENIPLEKAGRYITAGRYVRLANELDMPMNHLTTVLNSRTERPYRYWRLLANYRDYGEEWKLWPMFQEQGIMAMGWANLGDLSHLVARQESKDEMKALMKRHYNANAYWADQIFHFVTRADVGDLVIAVGEGSIMGVGRIAGPYTFVQDSHAPHQRTVEWLSAEEWNLPDDEAKGSTFRELKVYTNQVEIERHILTPDVPPAKVGRIIAGTIPELAGSVGKVQSILERKQQVILYGPPGTGKTFIALMAIRELAARSLFKQIFATLSQAQIDELHRLPDGLIHLITFHPNYGYEDFIEGYRPTSRNGQVIFELKDGIFKRLCQLASTHPERRYYLLIDEINRGDIPRIFGELLTLLEKDKRGQQVILPVSGEQFQIPENLYVVGTMNTADRSIALLDTALRRRFGFLELMPDPTLLDEVVIEGIPLGLWLNELNHRIIEFVGRDARNLQIGHAYLMENGKPIRVMARFSRVLQEDIIPLLEEYCYEDYAILEKILGEGFVDKNKQCIRHELFAHGSEPELIQALLEPTPELTTTIQAIFADEMAKNESFIEEDDDSEAG